jgi:hypothetical protein
LYDGRINHVIGLKRIFGGRVFDPEIDAKSISDRTFDGSFSDAGSLCAVEKIVDYGFVCVLMGGGT